MASKFHEGLACVSINGKDGFIDKSGNIVIPPTFYNCGSFYDGLASFRKKNSGKSGYINKKGDVAINAVYNWTGQFSDGFADVRTEGEFGFIDTTGRPICEFIYTEVRNFNEGRAAVCVGRETSKSNEQSDSVEKWTYIDEKGRRITEQFFDEANYFCEGLACVKIGGKYGYIDLEGKIAMEPVFESASDFSNGLAETLLEERSGYIDRNGAEVFRASEKVNMRKHYRDRNMVGNG